MKVRTITKKLVTTDHEHMSDSQIYVGWETLEKGVKDGLRAVSPNMLAFLALQASIEPAFQNWVDEVATERGIKIDYDKETRKWF